MSIAQSKAVSRLKALIRKELPEINLGQFDIPLTNGLPTPKLKDILESNVDEKYYLKNEVVEKIVKEANFQERLVSMKVAKSPKK